MSTADFVRTYRVTPAQFDRLLELVQPHLPHSRKRSRGRRYGKGATEHLLIFLYYIAHGSGLRRLAVEHDRLVGTKTNVASVHRTLQRTAIAVTDALEHLMQLPDRGEQRAIARRVEAAHRVPYATGCLGGCHIGLTPKNSSELDQCFMFKGFPSLALVAAVDDTLSFRHFTLVGPAPDNRTSTQPLAAAIAAVQEGDGGRGRVQPPYVMLGGAGFAPQRWLVTPYPIAACGSGERAFNAHHARVYAGLHRALCMLKASSRVLRLGNGNGVETTEVYARAAALLHNFRIAEGGDHNQYSAADLEGEPEAALVPGEEAGGSAAQRRASAERGGVEGREDAIAMRRVLHMEMAARKGLPPPLAVAAGVLGRT